ncbi:MAG: hypothetical protein J7L23_04180 [Candidatus Diapherotrites archaeon]|nr:hypothetical protein [Candidatus Diapherotrites archaeon]
MELEDFFNFKDFFRTMLLASSLFFIMGTSYGVFLHAMYSSQITGVAQDLKDLSDGMKDMADTAYESSEKTSAREWKAISTRAATLASQISPPAVTPNAYTYFNYWVASAAFVKLSLSEDVLGLDAKTQEALKVLDTGEILGGKGWWGRTQFNIPVERLGKRVQLLAKRPELQTYAWTFYIFVFIIGFITAFLGVKEKYDIPVLPEVIYGVFMPLPFFVIFAFTGLLAYLGVGFLDPSQVNILAMMISFVIMSSICTISAIIAVSIKTRMQPQEEEDIY